jgi:hypothetical protein
LQCSSHGSEHFTPQFASAIQLYPLRIDLPLQDWEEALRPILTLREEMFNLPTLSKSNSQWKRGFCDDCSVFHTIDNLLLHLSLLRGSHANSRSSQSQHSLWYPNRLGKMVTELVDHGNSQLHFCLMPFTTPMVEHRDANGPKRNYVSTRTSKGAQHLGRANTNSSGSDPAETMVNMSV